MSDIENQKYKATDKEKGMEITRKEALKKAGKYAAITAASLLFLSPKESQAQSSIPPPGW